ncbi:MAG: hypothetical protein M0Z94_04675, partial [Dehalococcoidales bacterium]|nr:hypothetical protein [Dehalococcoidales bacterium]
MARSERDRWSTSPNGMGRARDANRLIVTGNTLFYKRFLDDFPVYPLANVWTDTSSSFGERVYVVQTTTKIIERCMLMTTDPGDLVLDPTCVRQGTGVWAVDGPPSVPPHAGGQDFTL